MKRDSPFISLLYLESYVTNLEGTYQFIYLFRISNHIKSINGKKEVKVQYLDSFSTSKVLAIE
jgi:hypothetical protein